MPARVSSIALKSPGQIISPSDNVTLIVGPNNVGKSVILSGVQQEIANDTSSVVQPNDAVPVSTITLDISSADYREKVLRNAELVSAGVHNGLTLHQPTYIFTNGAQIPEQALPEILMRTSRLGAISSTVMTYLLPEGRGAVLASQGVPDLMNKIQNLNPMQKLWQDRVLEAKISAYMQRAFTQSLTVNRHAGANIHLHIGDVAEPEPQIGERTAYIDEIMKLPMLQNQGAGMLAFMGTVLTLATSDFQIVLLDEPEAFLHPPQARLLGEIVAEMSRGGGPQILVATHSDDFVQGVLAASRGESEVSIARVTRPASNENRVSQVPAAAVRTLYRDPLLRYSNIMDGIFYKGTVLCEAESDCTYYAAVLGHAEQTQNLGASDLLFTQCGGKDRFYRAFQALNAAAVPTAIVADIDLLADKEKFRELLDGMGGNFAAVEASYNILESSVSNLKVVPKRDETRAAMSAVLDAADRPDLSKQELARLAEAIRAESGWKQLKRKGEAVIDTGDPHNAFSSIVAACDAVGLFLVRNGELERFHPNIAGNKQEWLRRVLETEAFQASTAASDFLLQVRTFILARQ